MTSFIEQKFNIPKLKGISEKTIAEHLKLYAGYVKNSNMVLEKIEELGKNAETNTYVLGELQRRFSFEFGGMRNHEYYFRSLENGAKAISPKGELAKKITEDFGSFEKWLAQFKMIATTTRGIGWAVLYYDSVNKKLLNAWVDEQHIGHLSGLNWIFGIDMWEHAFYLDYTTDKKKYVESFLENVNWENVEQNFKKVNM